MAAAIPLRLVATTAIAMNPACAIDEYASMRLMSVCATASTEANAIVTTARTARGGCQSQRSSGRETTSTRTSDAKAAAFVPPAMNAVTGVGAPWYASGVH